MVIKNLYYSINFLKNYFLFYVLIIVQKHFIKRQESTKLHTVEHQFKIFKINPQNTTYDKTTILKVIFKKSHHAAI